jgi:hypothetical protein
MTITTDIKLDQLEDRIKLLHESDGFSQQFAVRDLFYLHSL